MKTIQLLESAEITEHYSHVSNAFCGTARTEKPYSNFSWDFENGKISVIFHGHGTPSITKKEAINIIKNYFKNKK